MTSGKTGISRGRRTQALIAWALLGSLAACSGGGGGGGDPVVGAPPGEGDPPVIPDPPSDPDTWLVGPENDFDPEKLQREYTLENPGPGSLQWNVQLTQPWMQRTGPASGTLAAGQSVEILVDVDPYGADQTGVPLPTGKVVFKNTQTSAVLEDYDVAVTPCFSQDESFAQGGTGGWTIFTPSADTRAVFVSSAQGNDSNSGLNPGSPKRTIAAGKALLRNGFPDWLLLRRGDVWQESLGQWQISGRSPTEPMVVGWYGAQANRPLLQTGTGDGLGIHPLTSAPPHIDNVAFVGLHFEAHTYTGSQGSIGLAILQPTRHVLFEDCKIEGYAVNVLFQGYGGRHEDLRMRRCIVVDAFDDQGIGGHPQGMFAWGVDGLLLEENLFDANGWAAGVAGAEPDIFSHNVYIDNGNTGVAVRGNIFANASSHGMQLRCGGYVVNNLFVHNPIALQLGGGNHPELDGIVPNVLGNVILDGSDIDPTAWRGWAMTFANVSSGRAAYNVIANNGGKMPYAMQFTGNQVGDTWPSIGVHNLLVDHNVLYNWGGNLRVEGESWQLSNLDFLAIDIQDLNHASQVIDHTVTANIASTDAGLNRFFLPLTQASKWSLIGGAFHTIDYWQSQVGDTTSQDVPVAYAQPNVSVPAYNGLVGGTASLAAFLVEARKQSFKNWRPEYMASRVNRYVRDGFRPAGG